MNPKHCWPARLRAPLILWPLLLFLSLLVLDITAETLDLSLDTASYQEDSDEFARRCSKVNKISIVSPPREENAVPEEFFLPAESYPPSTTLIHDITNFVRSGAKLAKDLTTLA